MPPAATSAAAQDATTVRVTGLARRGGTGGGGGDNAERAAHRGEGSPRETATIDSEVDAMRKWLPSGHDILALSIAAWKAWYAAGDDWSAVHWLTHELELPTHLRGADVGVFQQFAEAVVLDPRFGTSSREGSSFDCECCARPPRVQAGADEDEEEGEGADGEGGDGADDGAGAAPDETAGCGMWGIFLGPHALAQCAWQGGDHSVRARALSQHEQHTALATSSPPTRSLPPSLPPPPSPPLRPSRHSHSSHSRSHGRHACHAAQGRPACESKMHAACMRDGGFCCGGCADAAREERVAAAAAAKAAKEARKEAAVRKRREADEAKAAAAAAAAAAEEAERVEAAASEISAAYTALSLPEPRDGDDAPSADDVRGAHTRSVADLDGGGGGGGGDGGDADADAEVGDGGDGGDGARRQLLDDALRTLERHLGLPPPPPSGAGADQLAASAAALRKAEEAVPKAQAQRLEAKAIEVEARAARGDLELQLLETRALAARQAADAWEREADAASEVVAEQLEAVNALIAGAGEASSQAETATALHGAKDLIAARKRNAAKAARLVGEAALLTRKVHDVLAVVRQFPTEDEAAAMGTALASLTDEQRRHGVSAASLLDSSLINDEGRRVACLHHARALLSMVQLAPIVQPRSAPAAAAAGAAAAAAGAAAGAAGAGAAAAGAAAVTDDAWLHHAALFHGDVGLHAWCDARALALLRRADFEASVVPWADARRDRPPGAKPDDLLRVARNGRAHLGMDAPDPLILCRARLFVAAVFDVNFEGGARESADAVRALHHLRVEPCANAVSRRALSPCALCDASTAMAKRWTAIVKPKKLATHSLFRVNKSSPSALAWCVPPPPPASPPPSSLLTRLSLSLHRTRATPTRPRVRRAVHSLRRCALSPLTMRRPSPLSRLAATASRSRRCSPPPTTQAPRGGSWSSASPTSTTRCCRRGTSTGGSASCAPTASRGATSAIGRSARPTAPGSPPPSAASSRAASSARSSLPSATATRSSGTRARPAPCPMPTRHRPRRKRKKWSRDPSGCRCEFM